MNIRQVYIESQNKVFTKRHIMLWFLIILSNIIFADIIIAEPAYSNLETWPNINLPGIAFSLKLGMEPLATEKSSYFMLTDDGNDTSPEKTIISLDQPEQHSVFSIAAEISSPAKYGFITGEFSILTAYNPLYGNRFSIGTKPRLMLRYFSVYGSLMGSYLIVRGDVGRVGEAADDSYFGVPGGSDYSLDSNIEVSCSGFGFSASIGLKFPNNFPIAISMEIGQSFFPEINNWYYTISESGSSYGGKSNSARLRGIDKKPHHIDPSGFFWRLGIVIAN